MFERTQLLGFAGDAQIRNADFVRVALPGDRLAEFVERIFVDDAGHIHEAFLERWRSLLKDRVAAGFVTYRHHSAGAHARLVRGEHRAEERAEARAGNADAAGAHL